MPETVFLPYKHASQALEVSFEGICLDGEAVSVSDWVDSGHLSINLAISDSWEKAEFDIQVKDTNDQVSEALLPGESLDHDVSVVVATRNKMSRLRSGVSLLRQGDGWAGTFELSRAEQFGVARLQVFAVRGRDGEGDPVGKAWRRGEQISDSESWSVYTDEKLQMPGGAIANEWRDFSADESPEELRNRKDCSWHLDLSDSSRPRLYLNEGIAGLRKLLESDASKGKTAYLRESLVGSILQPVLQSLAVNIIADGEYASFEEMDDWQQKFMLSMARQSGNASEEETLKNWLTDWSDTSKAVLHDLQTAVQRYLSVAGGTKKLIRSFEVQKDD